MTTENTKKYFAVREVPTRYPISQSHLRKLIREKQIEIFKVGSNVRISEESLDAWMESRRVPALINTSGAEARP